MKLLSILLQENSNGIFSGKTLIDDSLQFNEFLSGYKKLAHAAGLQPTIRLGFDPDLKMDLTLAYIDPNDLHFRYVETTGELFYDSKILQNILNTPSVVSALGKLDKISPDPVEVMRRYGSATGKLNI